MSEIEITPQKHWISVCISNKDKMAKRIDLFDCMAHLIKPEFAAEKKDDSFLIFQGYSSIAEEYARHESELDKFSTIFIDCDNDQSDPHIIDKWKEQMKEWDYLIYETASSTPTRPKFRAIVPMDNILTWSKYAKEAIYRRFKQFADPKASWFYAPTRDKLETIIDHTAGRWFPSALIQNEIMEVMREEQQRRNRDILNRMKWRLSHPNEIQNPEGWRNLPSVKKCLEGLHKGERDNSLRDACYAMDKRGYRDAIPEFLNQCDVAADIRRKWIRMYRR